MLSYRIYHYENEVINNKIIQLYKNVFNINFKDDFTWWYLNNPFGKSIGAIALDGNIVVGHWAVTPLPFNIMGNKRTELISLASMVDPEYQGQGIYKKIGFTMLEYLKNEGKFSFIIAFPNDNAIKVHLNSFDYLHIRDFHFIRFNRNKPRLDKHFKLADFPVKDDIKLNKQNLIMLDRTSEYMKWRFGNSNKYMIAMDEKNNQYIFTRFKNKIDILTWTYDASEQDIISFANYLYDVYNPELVCTWNSMVFNEPMAREKRDYHFCIHFLNKERVPADTIIKEDKWLFQMGDSDIF